MLVAVRVCVLIPWPRYASRTGVGLYRPATAHTVAPLCLQQRGSATGYNLRDCSRPPIQIATTSTNNKIGILGAAVNRIGGAGERELEAQGGVNCVASERQAPPGAGSAEGLGC